MITVLKPIRSTFFLVLLVCSVTPVSAVGQDIGHDSPIVEAQEFNDADEQKTEENIKVGSIRKSIYDFTHALASGSTVGTIDAIEELLGGSTSLVNDHKRAIETLRNSIPENLSFGVTLFLLFAIFPLSFGLEKLTESFLYRYLLKKSENNRPSNPGSISENLSFFASKTLKILFFSLCCVLLFNLAYGDDATIILRAIFFTALSTLILGRVTSYLASIYLNSEAGLSSSGRKNVLNGLMLIVWTNCFLLFITVCSKHLQMSRESIELIIAGQSTIAVLINLLVFLYFRKDIHSFLYKYFKCEFENEKLTCRLVKVWLIPIFLYLGTIWVLQIRTIYYHANLDKGAFFLSLLAIPLYFILVRIGSWIVQTVIKGLNLYRPENEEDIESCRLAEDQFIERICRYVHPIMMLGLFVWVAKQWGYKLPIISDRADAILNITITIGISLLAWHLITTAIEKKLKSSEPETSTEDDEWGSESAQGREHTLLPVLRKCIGTILASIAFLICLSSLGINITPILAGAGVIGIAIGFGSQKIVSDILCGFFFLMDDAFRVGEYIEAGTIKGRVEEITLRNVLLRHHRGMLQIVPFSELASITNYMRGGIVEKFSLEFPYDTDVDKVRKIIKKVGLTMLEDEELGQDFIRPLKSQGVHEISNSVMTIRAKFTARPGKHFVIRREAYRRVTEALNAKGIFYAHKKVIVEVPDSKDSSDTPLEKAAAAASSIEGHNRERGPTSIS